MHAFTHSYIHICISFVYMYSFMCFVIFYLSLSFLTIMHFYHVFLACSIYSFRYVYHIFISYNLNFPSCHLLVTSYILLTYIFMYFIRLSYLMTYTYTFLSLYILLVLLYTFYTFHVFIFRLIILFFSSILLYKSNLRLFLFLVHIYLFSYHVFQLTLPMRLVPLV